MPPRHSQGRVHLKTAGSTYLEAVRTATAAQPEFFRELYAFALAHYAQDRASYHVSAEVALEQVAAARPTYGYRRLTAQLARDGQPVNSKGARRLMGERGVLAQKRRYKTATNDSRHAFPRYPNRVADWSIERPDQVWVGDITYIRLRASFDYLAMLMDVRPASSAAGDSRAVWSRRLP